MRFLVLAGAEGTSVRTRGRSATRFHREPSLNGRRRADVMGLWSAPRPSVSRALATRQGQSSTHGFFCSPSTTVGIHASTSRKSWFVRGPRFQQRMPARRSRSTNALRSIEVLSVFIETPSSENPAPRIRGEVKVTFVTSTLRRASPPRGFGAGAGAGSGARDAGRVRVRNAECGVAGPASVHGWCGVRGCGGAGGAPALRKPLAAGRHFDRSK